MSRLVPRHLQNQNARTILTLEKYAPAPTEGRPQREPHSDGHELLSETKQRSTSPFDLLFQMKHVGYLPNTSISSSNNNKAAQSLLLGEDSLRDWPSLLAIALKQRDASTHAINVYLPN